MKSSKPPTSGSSSSLCASQQRRSANFSPLQRLFSLRVGFVLTSQQVLQAATRSGNRVFASLLTLVCLNSSFVTHVSAEPDLRQSPFQISIPSSRSSLESPISPAVAQVAQANLPQTHPAIPGIATALRLLTTSRTSRDSEGPVIVSFEPRDAKAAEALEEDLQVMSRLIERKMESSLNETSSTRRVRSLLVTDSSSRAVRSFYFDGFGALFMLRVKFPLTGPAIPLQLGSDSAADKDWERAWQDMYGELDTDHDDDDGDVSTSDFNTNRLVRLKGELLLVLKHASNMQSLKADDVLAITVFGRPPPQTSVSSKSSSGRGASSKANQAAEDTASEKRSPARSNRTADDFARTPQATILTLRVKKAEVDAFGGGQLTLDQFRQKAAANAYTVSAPSNRRSSRQ